MIILLMGVSGAGKSTVGLMLAEEMDWNFIDADNLHTPENIAKMSRGIALTDADRQPWLQAIQEMIRYSLDEHKDLIIACSALKASDREMLYQDSEQVKLVYLKGSAQVLRERLRQRPDHFMSPTLLPSQLATLEEPEQAVTLEVDRKTPGDLVYQVMLKLGLWDRN
jgi:gluconokinase